MRIIDMTSCTLSFEKHTIINVRHTLWISSDRVMCVHTLPGGKALSSTNARNQSGSEGRGRRRRNSQKGKEEKV